MLMLVFGALCLAALPAQAGGRTPKPVIEQARGEKCIAEPERMRREHAEMLRHQRDQTVRQGVRGEKASLTECIACHASRASGSVAARREDFCASCHSYAGVKLDCFECHSARPKSERVGTRR
ncbi:MAG: Hdr-like menaquinol oxidoreductase cytochrome c subunit [Betaproteobacteria bacterium]|nr:Hdr-like menaquinol oxidoreductase cytochrome c subunit [Betaproteobacteria bacterium]